MKMTKEELFNAFRDDDTSDRFAPGYTGQIDGREVFVPVGSQEGGPQGIWVLKGTHERMKEVPAHELKQWLLEFCSGWCRA
jgi:hypothetical protein